MSNIREVARAAGVSVATVSRALSSPEKVSDSSLKKVKEAIEQVGYRPNMLARNFRTARSFAVVVLVPDITNPFFSKVIQSIEDRAQQRGYAVLLGDTRDSAAREQEYIHRVETRLADGVIQLRPESEKNPSAPPKEIPWVNACGCEGTPGPSVRVDNSGAARTLTRYLASLGHRRIGAVTGLKDNPHTVDRFKGYCQGLKDSGIPFDSDIVIEGDFSMWSGLNSGLEFCRMTNRPTAIFCMNDQMAIGVIQTFKAQGLHVPEDVSVIGFDNIDYTKHWDPSITTMSQPAEEMGKTSMDMLLRLIEGEPLEQNEVILPTEFIIRNSTAPPKPS